ncbi:MAG: 4'-phosphopantetheinyl transferase superfamily protein [Pseudomonadota bacterium]
MSISPNRVSIWWTNTQTASAMLDQFASETGLPADTDSERRSDASRWARIILRFGLSRFGDQSLVCCPIGRSANGRPELIGSGRPVFSISHSADHIAVAIADAGPLGIDLERHRSINMSLERQQNILQQASTHGLVGPSEEEGTTEDNSFLAVWTRLEAIAKARGDGIGAVLTQLKTTPTQMTSMFAQIDGVPIKVEPISLSVSFAAALAKPSHSEPEEIGQLPSELSVLRNLYDVQLRSGS